jgi:hypothetical protein
MLHSTNSGRTETEDLFGVTNNQYEIDYANEDDDQSEIQDSGNQITVPVTSTPVGKTLMLQLRQLIYPLSHSGDGFGIDLYLQTLTFLAERLQQLMYALILITDISLNLSCKRSIKVTQSQ